MRILDVIFALAGLLFSFPIILVLSLLVKSSSPGPVIYSQKRVGLHGTLFNIYKFRSMVTNADTIGTSITAGNDPRVTKIGSFLRKTKLDELPQLWNVLKGDMSFVGPRPDVPEIVNNYSPDMKKILDIRPGITSIATLYLRNEEDLLSLADNPDKAYMDIFIPAKVKLAMKHVEKKSILFDFKILAKTIFTLMGSREWAINEHSIVKEIKEQIRRQNKVNDNDL